MDAVDAGVGEELLDSAGAVAAWLRRHLRKGEGLTHPYARKLEIANYVPEHSLWTKWTEDRLLTFGAGLLALGRPVRAASDGVKLELAGKSVTVAANRSAPGEGLPDAYLFQATASGPADYVGDSPEVVVEIIRNVLAPIPPLVEDDWVQIGFPGRRDGETTYVGSWQWDIHGEARGQEFVNRAAAATLAAIEAARKD
ncbi:hypothetical protein BayCH28_16735 [Mycolicibacterium sp. CH28]|uniref:hypothetical protein n=1 Tax=Mycolicibacterium sp. CH28 TaxID=2512237 RepID=UPI001080F74A|nr:hypothetical protein [Mycolicibacterium sp. CH28]TGD86873.1 hypothetical protein BayCH28_16735 [Mycolicibacterium sp. CH28]